MRGHLHRGYAFWSLGHCYSPELDYKRALGHRILPRWDFIRLLRKYRGSFDTADNAGHGAKVCARCGVSEAPAGALKACSQCGVVFYCSRECQTAHWKKKGGDHKSHCVPKSKLTSTASDGTAQRIEDSVEMFSVLEPGDRCEHLCCSECLLVIILAHCDQVMLPRQSSRT
jgi:hypothetical protein